GDTPRSSWVADRCSCSAGISWGSPVHPGRAQCTPRQVASQCSRTVRPGAPRSVTALRTRAARPRRQTETKIDDGHPRAKPPEHPCVRNSRPAPGIALAFGGMELYKYTVVRYSGV